MYIPHFRKFFRNFAKISCKFKTIPTEYLSHHLESNLSDGFDVEP